MSNIVSHTPGPWNFYYREGQGYLVCQSETREFVADCAGLHSDDGLDEANARLIAAAPEMLSALNELLASELTLMPPFGSGKDAQDAWADRRAKARNVAAAVIAKAEGKQ